MFFECDEVHNGRESLAMEEMCMMVSPRSLFAGSGTMGSVLGWSGRRRVAQDALLHCTFHLWTAQHVAQVRFYFVLGLPFSATCFRTVSLRASAGSFANSTNSHSIIHLKSISDRTRRTA